MTGPSADAAPAPQGRPLRILQVGPQEAGPDSRGGIATVMTLILGHPDPAFRLEHAVTYSDGSAGRRVRLAGTGMARITAAVVRRDVDVVHAHMSFKGSVVRKALALRIARAAGVPTVLHAHSHGFTRWVTGLPRYQQIAVRTALRADRWLVLGTSWADEYAEHLHIDPRRITVLHNPTVPPSAGTTTWEWPDAAEHRLVRMVFLGRLGERKGCFDLVRALARLDSATRSRVHVVMAGDGEVEAVRQAAQDAGVADALTFPGWVDPQTRAALLADSDVLLLPSHQEGLPMAVLEGMAAGLAVLTTPVGGIPEVIDDDANGLLVRPGDDAAIAAALQRLTDDPTLRARLGSAAQATSADFDVEHWYAALGRIWRDVAAGHLDPGDGH